MLLGRLFSLGLICFFTVHKSATEQSCGESMLGKNGKFSRSDVSGLITTDNESQIKMCLVVLGKSPLDAAIAELLWRDLVKVYKTADDVPEDELQLLGWIATGIPAQDFMNLSLTEIETVAAFGQWRNFSKDQLMSLKQTIEYQWSYKGPSDLSGFDLAALGQVLCAFNTSQISAIKPSAFKAAAGYLSNLINCPEEIVKEFAKLATSKDAFGDPSEWTAIQVALIGCVIAGLDSVQDIRPDAFEGLSASSMQCLPTHTLQTMSMDQLSHLSLSAVNALSYAQRSSLNSEQTRAIEGTPKTLSSVINGGSTCRTWTWTFMTVLLTFSSTTMTL